MGNFSKQPLDHLVEAQNKGYVGLHVEQGVPVLDRDLNLLGDLISATVRSVIARYIGSGVPAGSDGFTVVPVGIDNDFMIKAGRCLVGGIEVNLAADVNYSAQDVPATATTLAKLTTPPANEPNPRQDLVYLDVWLEEVSSPADTSLLNAGDVGMQTSVRQRPASLVRVAENTTSAPPAPAGHSYYPIGKLSRPPGQAKINKPELIADLRCTRLTLTDVERRITAIEGLLQLSFDASPKQFTPKTGMTGATEVTLYGKGFGLGTIQVFFGSTPADLLSPPTPTTISTRVPVGAAAGSMPITVMRNGVAIVSNDTFLVFKPVVPPAPVFAAPPGEFTPKVGSPNTQVTLNGSNFDAPGLQVTFGATSTLTPTIVGPTQIKVIVPAMPAGPVNIKVTTTGGATSSSGQFTVL